MTRTILVLILLAQFSFAQIKFPFYEGFDSLITPQLPNDWSTSTKKSLLGDFVSTNSGARTLPNALISVDSKISQTLTTQNFNFTNKLVDVFSFFEKRSSTHNSAVVLEFSLSGDTVFTVFGDTLFNDGANYIERKIILPQIISGNPSVRFRWRIIGNGAGATGTYRIDDVTIKIQKIFDLSLSDLKFTPRVVRENESVVLEVKIKNYGVAGSLNCNLILSDSNKIFLNEGLSLSLLKNDSIVKYFPLIKLKSGEYFFNAKLVFADDEDTLNNFASVNLMVGNKLNSVAINEIMFAPLGDEPEWVEIFNSSADTINLKNWKINDATSSGVVITNQNNFLFLNEFIVVASDSNFKNYYPEIKNYIVAKIPSLNNSTSDAVVIKDFAGFVIDSVKYAPSWLTTSGNSIERIDYFSSINDSTNWATSKIKSTPGKQNSVARRDFDIEVSSFNSVRQNGGFLLSATITNRGRKTFPSFKILFFGLDNEIIFEKTFGEILSTKTLTTNFLFQNKFSGEIKIECKIETPIDERLENNFSSLLLKNSFDKNSLVINEIMFETDKSEYIEFYNTTDDSISLSGWKISDAPTPSGNRNTLLLNGTIAPKNYFIVAADSNIFVSFSFLANSKNIFIVNKDLSLGNSGDAIALKDLTDEIIDSVYYSSAWGLKNISLNNRSLEKISPQLNSLDAKSWSTSVSGFGGTPSAINSLFLESKIPKTILSLEPNPFSPDGDGFEDNLLISFQIPQNSSTIKIKIFDSVGRLIRTLVNNELSQNTGAVIWNGLNDDGIRAKIGPHIILFEALDNFGNSVASTKSVVVVATRLR